MRLTPAESLDEVRRRFGSIRDYFALYTPKEYPDYSYITYCDEESTPLVGGFGYIVNLNTGDISTVSASKPFEFHMQRLLGQQEEPATS